MSQWEVYEPAGETNLDGRKIVEPAKERFLTLCSVSILFSQSVVQ